MERVPLDGSCRFWPSSSMMPYQGVLLQLSPHSASSASTSPVSPSSSSLSSSSYYYCNSSSSLFFLLLLHHHLLLLILLLLLNFSPASLFPFLFPLPPSSFSLLIFLPGLHALHLFHMFILPFLEFILACLLLPPYLQLFVLDLCNFLHVAFSLAKPCLPAALLLTEGRERDRDIRTDTENTQMCRESCRKKANQKCPKRITLRRH